MSGQPDVYTEARIQRWLAEDPSVAELGLCVTIRPPKVFLRGEVPSQERRERAAELVHDRLPGFEIYNEIEVTGAEEPYGGEDLR